MIADPIDYNYDPNKTIKCRKCKWIGLMKDCYTKRIMSAPESWAMLAGRDGWRYHCPRCNEFITANYNRMS